MDQATRALPQLAARVTGIPASATVEMSEKIRNAQAAGREILPLASGDPNITTHPAIIEASHKAMLEGQTKYGPAAGIPALREAMAKRIHVQSGAAYSPGEVIVTPGGKFAVYAAMMAVVAPGDEVIILDPCWVSYGPCVKLAGGTPVVVPALDAVPLDRVAAAVTPKTRMIIVNSPVNPSGRVLPKAELQGLLDIAERHNLWLLFDQVYSELTFDGNFSFLQGLEGARERTFVADSLSKTYGMTGWRIGYLAAPERVIKPILKVVQHSVYCVPPFLQAGAVAALGLPDEVVSANLARFRTRRDRAAQGLSRLPGIDCPPPPATFYLFPSVTGDDKAVAQEWLEKMNIAALPGSAFGPAGAGHLRLSLACSEEILEEALARLARHYGVEG